MRKKIETRKKFGRICALVVVGMFVVMTLPTSVIAPPGDTPWTGGGNIVDDGDALGTVNPPEDPEGALVFVAGGGEDGRPYSGIQRMVIDHKTGFVGIALPGDIWEPPVPVNQLDVGGNMAVGEGFAGQFPAPPNGMIVEGWVGIGTPEPSCALEVVGDVWLNSDTIKMGDGTFYNKVQKDAKLSTGNFRIIIDENNDQTDRYFSVEKDEGKNDPQGSGTELMRCQENGNVGIATIAPTEKLDVNGRVRVRDLPIDNTLTYVVAADSTGVLHRRDAGTIGIQDLWETINSDSGSTKADSPTDTLNIYGAGIASTSISGDTLTITATEVDGSTTNELQNLAEVYAHDGATGNAVQLTAANGDIRFYNDDATEMLFLDESSGRIGIGTTAPQYKLDVVGNVHASGSFISGSTTTYGDGFITLSTGTDLNIDSGTLFIDNANDRVGIGTTNPQSRLQVDSSTAAYGSAGFHHPGGFREVWFDGGTDSIAAITNTGASTGRTDIGWWTGTALNPYITVLNTGNVGIGTTSPSQTLHVQGNARITGALYDSNNDAGTSGQILQTTGSGIDWVDPSSVVSDGDWTISGSDMYSAVSGNVGIGTTNPTYKLEVKNGNARIWDWLYIGDAFQGKGICFCDDPKISSAFNYMNIYLNTDDLQPNEGSFSIWKGGTPVKKLHFEFGSGDSYILPAGDFGIGTTNPAEKLDVAGTVQMTGFKMPTGASSGYVLTSDASGQGTWQPAPSGGIGGSGTTNYIPKFTGSTTLGNSVIYESGGNIGIGITSPTKKLEVNGAIKGNQVDIQGNVWTVTGYFKNTITTSAYGIYTEASGTGNNRAIFATASGGTKNWAGYFDQGNVFIQNKLGIGLTATTTPSRVLHIKDTSNPPLRYDCTTATGKLGQDLYIPIDVNGTIYYIKLYS